MKLQLLAKITDEQLLQKCIHNDGKACNSADFLMFEEALMRRLGNFNAVRIAQMIKKMLSFSIKHKKKVKLRLDLRIIFALANPMSPSRVLFWKDFYHSNACMQKSGEVVWTLTLLILR